MRNPGKLRWLIAVLVLALIAAACGGDDDTGGEGSATTAGGTSETAEGPSVSGDPVKIGLIAQEEELIAYPEMAIGAAAGQEYVNQELGGVGGAPLEVEVCTVGDTPESVVTCAQEFANNDEIKIVLMGTLNSGAGNEVLVGVGKPVLTLNNDIPDIITEGAWAFDPGALVLAAGLLKFAAEDLNASTYALMIPDDPFYVDVIAPLLEALAETYNLAPGGNAVALPLEGDPTASVTAANDIGADVLIPIANGPQCITVAEAVSSVGVTTPVVTVDTCMTTEVISSGALDGWFSVSVCEGPVAPENRSEDTYAKIVDTYGGGDQTLNSSFGCWTIANTIVAADILTETGGNAASADDISAAIGTYSSSSIPAYPSVSCPGPDPFVGACLRTATIVKLAGSEAALETFVDVDVETLGFLLEG
jgi:branched-chain amino acid transport system substrate-binding protein